MKMVDIIAREILDSRGNPTVEADVILEDGTKGWASVPSGASIGMNEALELRDKDPKRYLGKGVLQAIKNIHEHIAPVLIGGNYDVREQACIDQVMIDLDGSSNKQNLGANAILAVSLATAHAASRSLNLPLYRYLAKKDDDNVWCLPVPMINVINGGVHSDAPIDFQEFMIRPIGAQSFQHAVQMGAEVFRHLRYVLHEHDLNTTVGDEGGFAPNLNSIEAMIDCIIIAIKRAGYQVGRHEDGGEISLALDIAASEFFNQDRYVFKKAAAVKETAQMKDRQEMIAYIETLLETYPIDSIEDAMAEEDWHGWKRLTDRVGERCQLVGDDLFVTNLAYLERGIKEGCANAILIKVNQIGTLTETLQVIERAHAAGFRTVISHRSGETEDTTIADIAVATGTGQIKIGSLSRGERTAKYNQLLRIEKALGDAASYG